MAKKSYRIPALLAIAGCMIVFAACGSSSKQVCNAAGCCTGNVACAAPQYVFAAGITGGISVFPVDPTTGALASPTSTSGPGGALGMAVLNNQFLYVSNFQLGGTASVSAWTLAPGTANLTAVAGSPFLLGANSVGGGLAVVSSAQVLYVADAGAIDAFAIDSAGALSALSGSPFPAGTNVYLAVDPQNRFLFAAEDDPPGSIAAFTIDSTSGVLTAVAGSPFPVNPGSTSNTHPGQIVVHSSGQFVYTTLMQTNQVAAFSIDSTSGALTPVPGSPFTAGNGPFSLVATTNFLYVANSTDGTLSGYSIDATTGILTPLAGSPFPIHAGAMTTDLTGSFLYSATASGMMAFKINPTTGALTQVGSTLPFTGATALAFVQ